MASAENVLAVSVGARELVGELDSLDVQPLLTSVEDLRCSGMRTLSPVLNETTKPAFVLKDSADNNISFLVA